MLRGRACRWAGLARGACLAGAVGEAERERGHDRPARIDREVSKRARGGAQGREVLERTPSAWQERRQMAAIDCLRMDRRLAEDDQVCAEAARGRSNQLKQVRDFIPARLFLAGIDVRILRGSSEPSQATLMALAVLEPIKDDVIVIGAVAVQVALDGANVVLTPTRSSSASPSRSSPGRSIVARTPSPSRRPPQKRLTLQHSN